MPSFSHFDRKTFAAGNIGRIPIDLSAKWDQYVRCPVKVIRCLALGGVDPYTVDDYVLPKATGLIELSGHREGLRWTTLYIGFTCATDLPPPSFFLTEDAAVGTMTLSSDCFPAFLQLASARGAHFQIGGDGKWNALANDLARLTALDDRVGRTRP